MMFEMRRPTKPMPLRRANCSAIVSPTSFESEYDDSGRGVIDSSIGAKSGGAVEWQAEDRLGRGPDHPPHLGRDRRGEHVVGRHRVDPEGLALGAQLGRGDRREVDDGIGAGDEVVGLAEVGQVGDDASRRAALPSGRRSTLRTSWPCSRRSRTTHRPPLPLPPVTTIRMVECRGRGDRPAASGRGRLAARGAVASGSSTVKPGTAGPRGSRPRSVRRAGRRSRRRWPGPGRCRRRERPTPR